MACPAAGDEEWSYILPGPEDAKEEAGKDAPGWGKKKGKAYACAECGQMFGHREMIESRRAKRAVVVEGKLEELTP